MLSSALTSEIRLHNSINKNVPIQLTNTPRTLIEHKDVVDCT